MNIHLIIIFILGFCNLVYAIDQNCQKQFQNKEVARISRTNFVRTATKIIIYQVLSVSTGENPPSFEEKKIPVWLRLLQKNYTQSQSALSLEGLESMLNYVESIFGPFKEDDSALVFTKNGTWLKGLSAPSRREQIRKLKEMIQLYNSGHLHELSINTRWRSNSFAHFFKVIVFSYLMRFPEEQLKELVLNHLDYKKKSKIYYQGYENSSVLKQIEVEKDMRVFLYNLVKSMDSVLLKHIIMKELFILMRLYAINSNSVHSLHFD